MLIAANPKHLRQPRPRSEGFSLLEALISLLILLIGLLGLAGMMAHANRAEFESYQKKQALTLVQDMVDRLQTNRLAASCYAITTDTTNGDPYLGTDGISAPACTGGFGDATQLANQRTRAQTDLTDWASALLGTSEVVSGLSGANAGGALNARGCITSDGTVAVGTGSYSRYTVSVAWQAKTDSAAPLGTAMNCAKGSYSEESKRRVVSLPVWIPDLDS